MNPNFYTEKARKGGANVLSGQHLKITYSVHILRFNKIPLTGADTSFLMSR